jgi:hypothetical protein
MRDVKWIATLAEQNNVDALAKTLALASHLNITALVNVLNTALCDLLASNAESPDLDVAIVGDVRRLCPKRLWED